jgi:fused signal recognition particle receptor
MDGTAKGGIVLSIKDSLNIPVKFIGLGESMNDLQEFDLEQYIYGLCHDLMGE